MIRSNNLFHSTILLSELVAFALIVGCTGGSAKAPRAALDPAGAADAAMASYDANKDGALDASELSKCPALAYTLASLDANGDHKLSSDEISQKLSAIQSWGASAMGVPCNVSLDGRPLVGATVNLVPPDIFKDSLFPAKGVTDDQGVAHPTIGDENLAGKLKDIPLVYPGLYAVEIAHPNQQIPARYNTQTELGLLIDPTSREGAGARFDLKSN
jgi:hypothetical protein